MKKMLNNLRIILNEQKNTFCLNVAVITVDR